MVKMNGCAAIDSARPFRFLADKAAVAADFHLENGACYHEKRRIASTASVCTLAKSGVVRPGFPCRIASKSGEYPHWSLPFWQAMHGGTHSCVLQNFSLADLLQNLVGEMPQTPERFQRNRLRSCGAERRNFICYSCGGYSLRKASDSFPQLSFHPYSTA